MLVPTIEPKVKIEALPEWDGDHDTAIDYFWEVSQLANLQGWIPKALGFWLPTRLKKGSQIQLWFSTLPVARQAHMRSHYLTYLQVIKDRYLGKKWQLRMNLKFEQQSFRQTGHEKESPQKFLGRRTQYVRLLTNADDGGPVEVFLIMRKAPIAWSTILVLENIKSTEELYERINDHEEELVEVVSWNPPDALTLQNLPATLRRLGFATNGVTPANRIFRRANATEAEIEGQVTSDVEPDAPTDQADDSAKDGEITVRQVYAILQKRQCPPPKGGYPYAKNDQVMTKMGKAPPSPCKVCGSVNHWDRECPDWNVYIEKQKRGVLTVTSSSAGDEADLLYHSAYLVLLDGRISQESF
jgi:hypothetical protein